MLLKQILTSLLCITCACIATGAQAQAYPSRPVRLIVPFSPGSSTNDILGRGIAQRLTLALGQQVVVDNRPGAGGTSGSEIVAKTPRAIVQKLYVSLAKIAQTEDMKNFVQTTGAELSLLGPEAFAADIKSDITKWARVVKAAKIQPE